MSVPKGGRGKKQPYTTKTMRIPSPLFGEVESLLERFYNSDKKNQAVCDDNLINYEGGLELGDYVMAVSLDSFRDHATNILAQNKVSKKSTKHCFEKLLQSIFDDPAINL